MSVKPEDGGRVVFNLGEVYKPPILSTDVRADDGIDKVTATDITPLGDWEMHTRGIGSRLLLKMGFSGSGGLGKREHGRRLPVAMDATLHIIQNEIGLARPSLDRLVELRRTKKTRLNRKVKTRLKRPNKSDMEGGKEGAYMGSVFDFLNHKVLPIRKSESGNECPLSSSDPAIPKTKRELNIERYNLQVNMYACICYVQFFTC